MSCKDKLARHFEELRVSLVDADRQWFKAAHGLAARQTPRAIAFCAHAILGADLFEVPDAFADERFADNPLVAGAAGVRFYAGQPLEIDGARIGTLCVIDHVPRALSEAERNALRHLARAAARLLQQRRQTAELRVNQDRLHAFARASGDWFWETDAQDRHVWLSQEFERATGLSQKDHLGRPPCLCAPGDDCAREHEHLSAALKRRRGFREKIVRRYTRSGPRWIAYSAVPTYGADAEFAGHQGVARDVTEQFGLAAALEDARERLALAVESAGIGIGEWNLERGELIVDARTRASLELAPEGTRLTIEDWFAVLHPDERAEIEAQLQRARQQGTVFTRDFRVAGRHGRWRWCRILARPHFDTGGTATRFIAASWDITLQREAENLRLSQQAAEQASRAKSDFLSRASHELRTPLNAIMGFAQLLELDAAAPLADAQRRRLAHIRAAGEHLLALVEDLLDLGRIESGRIDLHWSEADPVEVVQRCFTLVEPMARQAQIMPALAAGAPRSRLRTDRRRLEQVLVNLLANAIKFNRPGGRVEVSIAAAARQLRIDVRDDGPGIAPEDLARLFQPFARATGASARVHGTGLGLVIARQIAQALGGDIEVRSELGAGSTFSIRLPLHAIDANATAEQGSAAPATAATQRSDRRPAAVLYVEDDPINALVVMEAAALRPAIRLAVANSGAEALAWLAEHGGPVLVLLDMHLPDMHGLDLLAQMRAAPLAAGCRFVALSSDALPDDVQRARAAGIDEYWTKSLNLIRFLADLDRLLGSGARAESFPNQV